MILNFKIKFLNIYESYFKGKVQLDDDEYTFHIQTERRGRRVDLPDQGRLAPGRRDVGGDRRARGPHLHDRVGPQRDRARAAGARERVPEGRDLPGTALRTLLSSLSHMSWCDMALELLR